MCALTDKIETIRRAFIAGWSVFFLLILPLTPFFSVRLLLFLPLPLIADEGRLALYDLRHRKLHVVGAALFTLLFLGLLYVAFRHAT